MSTSIYKQSDKTPSSDANLALLNADMASATNPFVTENDLDAVSGTAQRTGTALYFDRDAYYGNLNDEQVGNISVSFEGANLGVVAVLFHNNSSEPTYPASFIKSATSGDYVNSVVNYIFCIYLGTSSVLYSITQDA